MLDGFHPICGYVLIASSYGAKSFSEIYFVPYQCSYHLVVTDNFCHLGGFLYGFASGMSTIERLAHGFFGVNSDQCAQLRNAGIRFSGLILSIIAIMVTTVVLVQSDGVTSSCHGCRYISCVPFPPNTNEKWWYCDDCDSVTADLFRSPNGSGLYEEIQFSCPNGDSENVFIEEANITEKDVLRQALPGYCRLYCDEVFSSA